MKENRIVSEAECLERWRYLSSIEKEYKLAALPRMLDCYSNGWVRVDRGRPKEDKVRLLVNSNLSCKVKGKLEKYSAQIYLDISMANAEELRDQLTVLLKRRKK